MIAVLGLSYLLGSIPFGFLIADWVKKIDIRTIGSGNIGATNVFRVVGKPWGILVFLLDFAKGLLPILIARFLGGVPSYIFILIAVLAVCGHNWPIFLKFRGGKGVATSVGAVTGLSLVFVNLGPVLILSFCVWIVLFLVSRYVSLASLGAALAFFVFSLLFSLPGELKAFSFILFVFIVIRHKKNIKNLIKRREWRF